MTMSKLKVVARSVLPALVQYICLAVHWNARSFGRLLAAISEQA